MSDYIIWNPGSNLPPRKVIANRPEAIRAAGDMARQHGGRFYVCKLVHYAELPEKVKVTFCDMENAPF